VDRAGQPEHFRNRTELAQKMQYRDRVTKIVLSTLRTLSGAEFSVVVSLAREQFSLEPTEKINC
jgi:hypothetical protein